MMERKPFRPRKIVDYSKFVENDSDSDDFALPASKKNKVKHNILVDLTIDNNLSLIKSTSNDKLTNKKSAVIVVEKIEKDIPKIKDDDEDFKSAGFDGDSQKKGSRNNTFIEDKTNKITNEVSDLSVKKEIMKSEIKENDGQLKSREVRDNSAKAETNEKTDIKMKTVKSQLKVSESNKHSSEIKNSIQLKREEKITRDRKQTNFCINKSSSPALTEEMPSSNKTNESTILKITENVDQQKNIRKWKPPTRTTINSEAKLKSPLSSSNSGLRLGLSRNIRIKPLHSNVKIQS